MQDKVNEVLDGKLKLDDAVTDLTAEQLVEFNGLLKKASVDELDKVSGLRAAKRDLEAKVTEAQSTIDKAKEAGSQTTQFRQEQVEIAKNNFYTSFGVSDEDKPKVDEMFKKIDSGKVTAELIQKDFVSAFAAVNPDKYLEARNKLNDLQKNAEQARINGAGSNNGTPPPGGEPPKFSDAVMATAKAAGITPEAAQKVADEGMTRRI